MTVDGAPGGRTALRYDLQLIADMIETGSRVLDVGCGDGALLDFLAREKDVDGRGIELSQEGVNACVSNGLSVIQGDADTDLANYPSDSFDYVILSQTLQATHNPGGVLGNLMRIGYRAAVSFANYGHWHYRLRLLFDGRMPVTGGDGSGWYENPDIHLCTIRDFVELSDHMGLQVEKAMSFSRSGGNVRAIGSLSNLRDEQAVFLLKRN